MLRHRVKKWRIKKTFPSGSLSWKLCNSRCGLHYIVCHAYIYISRVSILGNWHNTGCVWLPDARSIQQNIPEWSGPLVHRTVPSHAFVHVSSSLVAVYTLGSSRAYVAREQARYGPAHVSANLIYFGPDKKLIYREARPGSLGKRRFSAPSREPEVTRRLARVSARTRSRWNPFSRWGETKRAGSAQEEKKGWNWSVETQEDVQISGNRKLNVHAHI